MTENEIKLFSFGVIHLRAFYQLSDRQKGKTDLHYGEDWLINYVIRETGITPTPEERTDIRRSLKDGTRE